MLTVLNRKYYDMLRKQYNRPISRISDGFDVADERDEIEEICLTDEDEQVRRAISRLASIYREAMKRGYLYDGDYDNDYDGVRQNPAPMIFAVEK